MNIYKYKYRHMYIHIYVYIMYTRPHRIGAHITFLLEEIGMKEKVKRIAFSVRAAMICIYNLIHTHTHTQKKL